MNNKLQTLKPAHRKYGLNWYNSLLVSSTATAAAIAAIMFWMKT